MKGPTDGKISGGKQGIKGVISGGHRREDIRG